MTPRRITLHIEELVLHGFSARDGQRIADAVQSELTRLLTGQGLAGTDARPRAEAVLDAGEFRLPSSPSAHKVGCLLAEQIYRGLQS